MSRFTENSYQDHFEAAQNEINSCQNNFKPNPPYRIRNPIVKSKSLLDIFSENNIQECNFLKLDCEGAEYDIINSLPSDFLNKIKKSVIEYHLADTHPKLLEQLIKKLRKYSFIVNTRPLFSDIGFLFANKK